jgi:hypothetical protein
MVRGIPIYNTLLTGDTISNNEFMIGTAVLSDLNDPVSLPENVLSGACRAQSRLHILSVITNPSPPLCKKKEFDPGRLLRLPSWAISEVAWRKFCGIQMQLTN